MYRCVYVDMKALEQVYIHVERCTYTSNVGMHTIFDGVRA